MGDCTARPRRRGNASSPYTYCVPYVKEHPENGGDGKTRLWHNDIVSPHWTLSLVPARAFTHLFNSLEIVIDRTGDSLSPSPKYLLETPHASALLAHRPRCLLPRLGFHVRGPHRALSRARDHRERVAPLHVTARPHLLPILPRVCRPPASHWMARRPLRAQAAAGSGLPALWHHHSAQRLRAKLRHLSPARHADGPR